MNSQLFQRCQSIYMLVLGILYMLLSGCQLIKIKTNPLNNALSNKTDSILTNAQLSESSSSLLSVIGESPASCLKQVEDCISQLKDTSIFDAEERYAAISEIYLAKAFELEKLAVCKSVMNSQIITPLHQEKNPCLDQQLFWLDKSLRYSFVYLFKTPQHPQSRIFDQRQMQVRTFYNVSLSRLMTSSYQRYHYSQIPKQLSIGSSQYQFDLSHYPSLKQHKIERLQSSYILNFSGFYTINRQEGLGSEFVLVTQPEQALNNTFILDPEQYFKHKVNPNIHTPRYLSISATAEPAAEQYSAEDVLSGQTPLTIKLFNPHTNKTTRIETKEYTLTANYSVPFALWLAENKLGSSGYLSLINRAETLQMPHLYMIEPYQANKKIIVMIHGLASSPETWVSLTNNILGDKRLRDHYQVWQIFYSTNMPIFESRFQINVLLKQAFAQVQPNSASAHDAVLIGHSMGGIISRLLVSDADVSDQAIPFMNYEQYIKLQQHPVIRERFQFKAELPFTRAIFIAAPHRGSDYTDRWYTEVLKKIVKIPYTFAEQVDMRHNDIKGTKGLIDSGAADLSPGSHFMQVTQKIMPRADIPYHSILGNQSNTPEYEKTSDGIVPYWSSHLEGAVSETIIHGGHSIHEKPETILQLRRILREHLDQSLLKH